MYNEHGCEATPAGNDGEAARAEGAVCLADGVSGAGKGKDAKVVNRVGEVIVRHR